MAVSIVCFAPTAVFADTLGPLTYVDNGSSITISNCQDVYGDLVIPPMIDGKPVTAIGEEAFSLQSGIRTISIPAGVINIGKRAFFLCSRLRNVSLPSSLTAINDETFLFCRNLTEVTIPAGVRSIGVGAFGGCTKLDNLIIPSDVRTISAHAFSGCKLTSLTIPENVTTIGDSAFMECGIESLKIRSGKVVMGEDVFAYCRSLVTVELSEGIMAIEAGTFNSCSALTSVRIPSSLNRIGRTAFRFTSLNKIDFGPSLKVIEGSAFQNCAKLSMVTLPASVKVVGDKAFAECPALLNVFFLGDAPVMGKKVFLRATADFRVYFSEQSRGYTIPRWHGYRSSLPKEEIEVLADDGSKLTDGEGFRRLGSTIVGETSRTKRFVIRNVGVRKLTGIYARISGGDSADFTVKNLTKSSLAPGQTAHLDLLFQPKQGGRSSSQLEIMSSDANEDPFEVDLSGLGLQLVNW